MPGNAADKLFAWGCMAGWAVVGYYTYENKGASMMLPFVTTAVLLFVVYPLAPTVSRAMYSGFDRLDESKLKQGLWINTIVSLLHSYAASFLSVLSLALSWDQLGNMLNIPHNPWPFACVAVSTGYFAYDTWDFIQSGLWRRSKHIVVHHFAVTSLFFTGLYQNLGVLYLCVTLICEINSVFLHTRTLMTMAERTLKDASFRLVWSGVWITFYLTRFSSHGGLVLVMLRDYHPWVTKFWPPFWWLAMAGLFLFNGLNLQLYFAVGGVYRKAKKELKE